MMRSGPLIPVSFFGRLAENPNRNNTEKSIAIPLARCARVPRATAQPPASLILGKGGPPAPSFPIPPVPRALPLGNPATLARGGRALIRWAADAVTWAGDGCAVASCRTYLTVTGACLTRWAGQAANAVGGVRGAGWTPRALPLWTGAA
jgi:hypothetical protein